MGESLTVRCVRACAPHKSPPASLSLCAADARPTRRLFVQTQTYDIPCDPRQPAQWLLLQAKNIQRTNLKKRAAQQQQPQAPEHSHNDELEVLYNRTTRSGACFCKRERVRVRALTHLCLSLCVHECAGAVIELGEPIGRCISPMDVVDARTLLQTPDTTFSRCVRAAFSCTDEAPEAANTAFSLSSAMFPWLRSYPGGLQLSEDSLNSANGLFFQQLYAYTLIGKRTPPSASQRKAQQSKEAFHALLDAYVRGSFDDDKHGRSQQHHPQYAAHRPAPLAPSTPARDTATATRRTSGSSQFYSAQSPPRRLEFPPPETSDSEDAIPLRVNAAVANSPFHSSANKYRNSAQSPTSPSLAGSASPARRVSGESAGINPLDDIENVFDIVFKQQAIGMKLGADETKQFAVVKECFDNSEAARYPEIQNGVVILAVNGQEVAGLGLSRVLYRLREAPRPVVVRFGRIASRPHQQPTGTWG